MSEQSKLILSEDRVAVSFDDARNVAVSVLRAAHCNEA
jgi:hypothetical protein